MFRRRSLWVRLLDLFLATAGSNWIQWAPFAAWLPMSLASPGSCMAAMWSYDIPEIAGQRSVQVDIDLGQRFSRIDRVGLLAYGTYAPGWHEVTEVHDDYTIGFGSPMYGDLSASLTDYTVNFNGSIFPPSDAATGTASLGETPRDFFEMVEFSGRSWWSAPDAPQFEMLLDGKATLIACMSPWGYTPFDVFMPVMPDDLRSRTETTIYPDVVFEGATLVVFGQAVPEQRSMPMALLGAAGLPLFFRHKRRGSATARRLRGVETLEGRQMMSASGWQTAAEPAVSPAWFQAVAAVKSGGGLVGDFNSDGCVDSKDASLLISKFHSKVSAGIEPLDLDGNGSVGMGDAEIFVQNFGQAATAMVRGADGALVEAATREWIVQLSSAALSELANPGAAAARLAEHGLTVLSGLGQAGQLLVRSPTVDGAASCQLFASMGLFDSYSPNAVLYSTGLPNDPQFSSLWGLHNTGQTGGVADADIDAPESWDATAGRLHETVIGVIDTGIDYTHPDLDGAMWRNPGEVAGNGMDDDGNGFVDDYFGYDFANNDSDPMDDNAHGTHVAGTIAAEHGNGIGVAGVAPNAKVMALKFLRASGSGSLSGAIRAINYATMMKDRGVNIVATNNSYGGGGFDAALESAIRRAGDSNILFVAAAGNGGFDGIGDNNDTLPYYPSSYSLENIIAVAATNHDDVLTSFSNYGAASVDLVAPGSAIWSTVPGGGYAPFSGTSMAAPHVAGAVAMLQGLKPGLSMSEVKDALFGSVDKVSSLSGRVATGGRLNVAQAIESIIDRLPSPSGSRILGATDASIAIGWQDNSATETGFRVLVSTDKVNWSRAETTGADSTSLTVHGLQPKTTYYLKVQAVSPNGDSAFDLTVTGTTGDPRPTLSASQTRATNTQLSWVNNSTSPVEFRIMRSDDGGSWKKVDTVGGSQTAYHAKGLEPGSNYRFRVDVVTASGEVFRSEPISLKTDIINPPRNVKATDVNQKSVELSWKDNGANETQFRVATSSDGGATWKVETTPAGDRTYRVRGLNPQTTYLFKVRTFVEGGHSDWSTPISVTTLAPPAPVPTPTPQPPTAPTKLRADEVGKKQVTLQWRDNSSDEQAFRIAISRDGGKTWDNIGRVDANVTTFKVTGLDPNTNYVFKARGVRDGMYSDYSNELEIRTKK